MLQGLQGHENIINVRGFSATDCAILMDFCSFVFNKISLPCEPVSSLKAFLAACDDFADFEGFHHVQFHVATDICAGLEFLHSKHVVHRDLKPDNILVSNQHYLACDESDMPVWWATKPVRVILTDFGEARSTLVQTKTLSHTSTQRLFRGSPAYMAPEAIADDGRYANIEQLKMMDVFSLGMIMYMLLNPNAQYPYVAELDAMFEQNNRLQSLRRLHAQKLLPRHLEKYHSQQLSVWKPLHKLFMQCTDFTPEHRPQMPTVCRNLLNDYVCVTPLTVSQSSVSEMLNVEPLMGLSQGTAHTTDQACTFLALLVANKMLKMTNACAKIEELTTDVIVNFPLMHLQIDPNKMYSVDEAYKVLRAAGTCAEYVFNIPIYSNGPKPIVEAQHELCSALCSLLMNSDQSEPMCAVYTCPPYTILICRPSAGLLTVVDTHIVSKRYGGNNTAAIVTAMNSETSVAAICSWIFRRLALVNEIRHELSVMVLSSTQSPVSSGWFFLMFYFCMLSMLCVEL